jgi:nitrite reductase/ring-hydroxylating ferredoxin subunit
MSGPDEIPKWREDFPLESEADEFIARRDFLRFVGLVSAGLAVGNGLVYVKSLEESEGPFPEVEVAGADELAPGTWKVFRYPDARTPAILVRRESGQHLAFQQKCPHLSCPVTYHRSDDEAGECLRCHCHNGRFDLATGQGVQGPPRELRPLRQVVLLERGGRLWARGLNEVRGG